jgi:hypothetical protein
MQKLTIIAPTILSLFTIALTPKANAAPHIYPSSNGIEVNVDNCYARFDNNGNLLQGGSMCDDKQLFEAKQAVQSYLREQDSSTYENEYMPSSSPQIYRVSHGFALNIGNCYAEFDNYGNLTKGGSMCDDKQLYEAKQAAQNYVRRQR